MNKFGYVYIMTNKNKTTLYIGVTTDLVRRIYEHKNHLIKNSFTAQYNLEYCIYYEEFTHIESAINREKELKKWNRKKKEDLINKKNPEWRELVNESCFIRDSSVASLLRNDNALREERKEKEAGELFEIPHYVRNDNGNTATKGKSGGGGECMNIDQSCCAAAALPPPFLRSDNAVIPNEAQRNEESRTNTKLMNIEKNNEQN
jgi:putative endonuclease